MTERQILSDFPSGGGPARPAGFIIEAWRHAALGNPNTAKLLQDFQRHCGAAAESVFESWFIFLRVLGRESRRRLRVGHPGCSGMTPDETQLLSLLAAAQSGHWALFDARLCWLAPNGARAKIAAAAMILADALSRCGADLSQWLAPAAAPGEAGAFLSVVRTVH